MEISILMNSYILNLSMEKEKGDRQGKDKTRHKEQK